MIDFRCFFHPPDPQFWCGEPVFREKNMKNGWEEEGKASPFRKKVREDWKKSCHSRKKSQSRQNYFGGNTVVLGSERIFPHASMNYLRVISKIFRTLSDYFRPPSKIFSRAGKLFSGRFKNISGHFKSVSSPTHFFWVGKAPFFGGAFSEGIETESWIRRIFPGNRPFLLPIWDIIYMGRLGVDGMHGAWKEAEKGRFWAVFRKDMLKSRFFANFFGKTLAHVEKTLYLCTRNWDGGPA